MPLAASPLVCSVLVAVAAGAAPPIEATQPTSGVLLRYRFAAGEDVAYRIDHDSNFTAAKGQLVDKNSTRTRTAQRYEVASVEPDGTAVLRVVIDHARMEYAFNDEKPAVFDSNEKTLPAPVFAGVAAAVGQPLAEIRVRASGKVESARPLLNTDALNGTPGKSGVEGDGPASLFAPFPDRPLAIGDEWSDSFVTRITVTKRLHKDVTILRQYRLESVEGGVATIAFKTAPLTAVAEPSQLVQLIQRTSSGKIRFDVRAGRILGRKVEVDNVEIGWAGADSTYRARCTWDERLVPATDAKVSAR